MDEVRLRFIGNDVFLLEDCSSPLSKEQLCLEIAASGIDTLLLIAEDNTPWSFRLPSGLWCYCRPLADPESPSPALLQRIADFVEYETGRGRRIAVWIGYDRAEPKLLDTIRDAGDFRRYPGFPPMIHAAAGLIMPDVMDSLSVTAQPWSPHERFFGQAASFPRRALTTLRHQTSRPML